MNIRFTSALFEPLPPRSCYSFRFIFVTGCWSNLPLALPSIHHPLCSRTNGLAMCSLCVTVTHFILFQMTWVNAIVASVTSFSLFFAFRLNSNTLSIRFFTSFLFHSSFVGCSQLTGRRLKKQSTQSFNLPVRANK